jgi:hypothetical protein
MKQRAIMSLAGLCILMSLLSATIRKSSSGAPASHTGAPGEKTCAAAGCHDDTTPNIGEAQVSLELGDNTTTFIPGKTYPVKVRIVDDKASRFGFQIVALDAKSLADVGAFRISDSARTQVVSNEYKLKERKYVTYTFDGTDAVSEGKGEWTVDWTAPADAGKVTFYVAAVSANDDMSDKGDKVYTTHYTFKQGKSK